MEKMVSIFSDTDGKIKAVVDAVDDLKPLPDTVTRALGLMREADVSVSEIVSALSIDQALTARILKLANSAYYGFVHPSTTLHEAVSRLGFRRTRNILLTVSYSSLLGRRVAGYNLGHGELWRHSVAVATIAQRISERVVYPAPDEAYIGGLLHDIGKLALDQYYDIDWDQLLRMGQMHEMMLIEAEEHSLGLNHAQIGGELARKWDLPLCLVDAIAKHHDPASANSSPELAALVHMADIICLRLGVGLAHADFLPRPNPEAMQLLSLDHYEIDQMTDFYSEMLETATGQMQAAIHSPRR
jgi:putative nucleotidyltransferase with HDIG domain